jgi:hypothetical protein
MFERRFLPNPYDYAEGGTMSIWYSKPFKANTQHSRLQFTTLPLRRGESTFRSERSLDGSSRLFRSDTPRLSPTILAPYRRGKKAPLK